MRKTHCSRMKCVIYRQLAEVRMSDLERRRAAYALRDAEVIADAVIRVKDGFASLGAVLLKPGFRQS